eukprot:TRINITY_DN7772_c0_g1_i1.p2 TRINITY_DN7772_c0_g1~~TRINITY_DN7772_c0_g1_i1.p2  ORF type:complete len:129 (-),score=31.37 TRINITY_DN7772_c0_g1_i1:88-474(-)
MKSARALVVAALLPLASAIVTLRGADSGCLSERRQGQAAEPSAGAACGKCKEFQDGHKDSEHVQPNKPLCPTCYSMKSLCSEGQYTWACYDEHEMFEVFQKQDAVGETPNEPADLHSFTDREPAKCEA